MDLNDYFNRPSAESMVAFAREIGVNVDQVRQWRHRYEGRRPMPETCAEIERATGGLVPCEALRDDITWARIRDKTWKWHPDGRPVHDVAKAIA